MYKVTATDFLKQSLAAAKALEESNACEEASMFSKETYIPCGAFATKLVLSERGKVVYRMCDACAEHNINNRGAELVGVIEQ